MQGTFKKETTFDWRCGESARLLETYEDRIPIICETNNSSLKLDKCKYLVPKDLTFAQFQYIIRKRLSLSADQAIFIFVNNLLPSHNSLMLKIYEDNKDKDGFVYSVVALESAFGKN